MADSDTVKDGDSIVAHMHDGIKHIIHITNRDEKVGRTRTSVKGVVGHSYGSIFEINSKRKLVHLPNCFELLETSFETGNTDDQTDVGNNSNYVDSNTAQKLTMQDLADLRVSINMIF
jgi:hypothetical protein